MLAAVAFVALVVHLGAAEFSEPEVVRCGYQRDISLQSKKTNVKFTFDRLPERCTELAIVNVPLDPGHITALKESIEEDTWDINSLVLENNSLSERQVGVLASALIETISIRQINFNGNQMGSIGAGYIAMLLNGTLNDRITKVSLRGCNIGDAGAAKFGKALREQSPMRALDLSFNNISGDGMNALSQSLRTSSLSVLDLGSNHLGNKGVSQLATSLAKSSALTVLYLDRNDISDSGAVALSKAISQNTALNELHLARNRFTEDGRKVLEESKEASHTMTTLIMDAVDEPPPVPYTPQEPFEPYTRQSSSDSDCSLITSNIGDRIDRLETAVNRIETDMSEVLRLLKTQLQAPPTQLPKVERKDEL